MELFSLLLVISDYDMTSDEGDGYSQLELTINYDDLQERDSSSLAQAYNA
jgi:hypothetical protein